MIQLSARLLTVVCRPHVHGGWPTYLDNLRNGWTGAIHCICRVSAPLTLGQCLLAQHLLQYLGSLPGYPWPTTRKQAAPCSPADRHWAVLTLPRYAEVCTE